MQNEAYLSGSPMSQTGVSLSPRHWRSVKHPAQHPQPSHNMAPLPASEASDGSLVKRSRSGEQDAATQIYLRYGGRLTSLVKKRCSTQLARHAGVEDIVQSVFVTFFRRIGEGCYDVSDGDVLWNVLAVIARNRVRTAATYYYAAKRNACRTIDGLIAREFIESHANAHDHGFETFEQYVQEILEQLPSRSRLLVELRLDGFTIAESAKIARCSRRTAERVMQEMRLTFSELLGTENRNSANRN